jgi:hypothetical protein
LTPPNQREEELNGRTTDQVKPTRSAQELESRRRSDRLVNKGEHLHDVARLLGDNRSSFYAGLKLYSGSLRELDAESRPYQSPRRETGQLAKLVWPVALSSLRILRSRLDL